jgi:hypothetical protein
VLDWQPVHHGLDIKLCPSGDESNGVLIFRRSRARQEGKRAFDTRFVKHIEQWLERLQENCTSTRVKTVNGAEQRIGRLLEENQRAASLFDIHIEEQNEIIHVDWTLRNNDNHWGSTTEGRYLLRTIYEKAKIKKKTVFLFIPWKRE